MIELYSYLLEKFPDLTFSYKEHGLASIDFSAGMHLTCEEKDWSMINGKMFYSYPYYCELLSPDEDDIIVFMSFDEAKSYFEKL